MPRIVNLFILILLSLIVVSAQNVHKRFEYKYSFKGPYLAQKNNQVPFWSYTGSAIASEESFRITPSLRSQKGQAWVKHPTSFAWWEVEMVFRVNGRGRIGADGLALWFTTTHGVEGPVFGNSDKWHGLGLFFDSFDNDNKRNNPYVMGMINDGTIAYDHENDGASQQLGGCLRDFRNKPFPIRAKIEYFRNVLTVYIHNGMTDNEKDYEMCFRAENVHLPSSGYFGVTAATGALADDHDVLKFLVHSLRSPEEIAQLRLNTEEESRYQKEFEDYQEKTKKAREEYIAAHPDAGRREDDLYETSEQRELRQIFQGQAQIYEVIRHLNKKMDDLLASPGLSMALAPGGQAVGGDDVAQPAPAGGVTGGISRNEVAMLMSHQKELVQNVREIKSAALDIQTKAGAILAKGQGSVQPVGVGGGYDMHVTLKELNEGLNIVKRDVGAVHQRMGAGSVAGCPPQPSCVSTTLFVVLMLLQVVCFVGYFMFRDSREARAKKFY